MMKIMMMIFMFCDWMEWVGLSWDPPPDDQQFNQNKKYEKNYHENGDNDDDFYLLWVGWVGTR